MALEVTEILLRAQSVDGSVRKHAEERLKQFEEQETSLFLLSLSAELANEKKPVCSRKLAGLVLRDALYAIKDHIRFSLIERWYSLDVGVKTEIENNLLLTLKSCVDEARFTALQVIAIVDLSKLSDEEWLKHIGPLLRSSNQDVMRLETLGYVSCALGEDEQILKAIVEGMKASEASNDVRLAATRALYHALGFGEEEITKDIMEAVCDAAVSTDVKIQQAAFECLLFISLRYYWELGPYVKQIMNITCKAVKQDEEPVALQAIEIWSSICNKEIDSFKSSKYIERALSGLVPMLLETLRKQEDQDGACNVAMAGRRCLGLVGKTVGDAIVPLVTPFVEENIKKSDWRQREAATYAFGSILLGFPSLDKLVPLHVEPTLSLMLTTLIEDHNNHLKDTTAWTLGNMFGCLYYVITPIVVTPAYCQYIVTVLLRSMKKDAPNVAEKASGALYHLVYFMNESNAFTSSFHEIVLSILTVVTEREDAGLRSAACETLKEAVRCSTFKEVLQLLPIIKKDLEETLEEQNKQNERRRELLCWFLDKVFQGLWFSPSFKQHADGFMNLLFRVLACPSATAHEEAMLAVASLAYTIGPDFAKHMPEFYKFLEKRLQNLEGSARRECEVTLEVVGRIFRALKDKGLTWSESVMGELLGHYDQVDLSVKPLVLSCFGDIATGIQDGFSVYFDPVFSLIDRAKADPVFSGVRDDEMMEHTENLEDAAIKASRYIKQALRVEGVVGSSLSSSSNENMPPHFF